MNRTVARSCYSRMMLIAILVEHQRASMSTCSCGWDVLGSSFAEHIADKYEAAMNP